MKYENGLGIILDWFQEKAKQPEFIVRRGENSPDSVTKRGMIYGALKPEQRAIRTVWEELAIAIEGRTIVTTDAIVLQAIQSTLEARQSRDAWRYTLSHVRNQAKAAGGWFVGDRIQARRWPEHVDPVRNAYIITNDSELAKLSHVEIAESHKLEVGSIMDVARRLTNDQAI